MLLVNYFILITKNILDFLSSINAFFIIISLVFIFHVLNLIIRDKKHINALKEFEDPKEISIKDLQYLPIVNIIIPAWKEGEEFQDCLNSIIKLKYPKLKIIVNAGGSEETIKIANSFKKYSNFTILHQKGGKDRAALGKIKALNETFKFISEGLVYMIDADCVLTDELLIRMILPIINANEKVVIGGGVRPLKSQEHKDLVRYLEFTRYAWFKINYTRYNEKMIGGGNSCVTYDVIQEIGKFNEDRIIAEDISRGMDILSKGFKIYQLNNYQSNIPTDFPITIKELINQRRRYVENTLLNSYQNRNWKNLIKTIILLLISYYILIFPIFILFNIGFFFIGISLIIFQYFIKLRAFIFFKRTVNKDYYRKFRKRILVKMLLYTYIELITNTIIPFTFFLYLRKIKKKK